SIGQVWVTEDGAKSWRSSRLGLPSVAVQSLSTPLGWDGPWFLGTRTGVFRSMDHGETWQRVAAEMGVADVTALVCFVAPVAELSLPASTITAVSDGPPRSSGPNNAGAGEAAGDALQRWLIAADALSGDLLMSPDLGGSWQRVALRDAGSRI